MILPSKGISIQNVKTALNSKQNNLGALVANTNINKWSWWKPLDIVGKSIDENVIVDMNGGFSNLQDMKCDSILSLQNKIEQGQNIWNYQRPQTEYRLGDFRNYNTDSIPWTTLKIVDSGLDTELGLRFGERNYLPQLAQMSMCRDMNGYGLLFYYKNSAFDTKYYHLGTLSTNDADYNSTFRIAIDKIPSDTRWKIILCLSNTNATKGKMYDYSEVSAMGFRFMAMEAEPLEYINVDEITKLFNNVACTLNWVIGSYSNGRAVFQGSFDVFNNNDEEIQMRIEIYNNAEVEENRTMYDNTLYIGANDFVSISDLANSTWYTYQGEGSAQMRMRLTIYKYQKEKTKEFEASIDSTTQFPKTFNYTNE